MGQSTGVTSGNPSNQPIGQPTGVPSGKPSNQPAGQPNGVPSGKPSNQLIGKPPGVPRGEPSSEPRGIRPPCLSRNKPSPINKEWFVRHQLIGSSRNKPSFQTKVKKVQFVRPSIQLTPILAKAGLSTKKPVLASTLVKGDLSPRKPMLAKAI